MCGLPKEAGRRTRMEDIAVLSSRWGIRPLAGSDEQSEWLWCSRSGWCGGVGVIGEWSGLSSSSRNVPRDRTAPHNHVLPSRFTHSLPLVRSSLARRSRSAQEPVALAGIHSFLADTRRSATPRATWKGRLTDYSGRSGSSASNASSTGSMFIPPSSSIDIGRSRSRPATSTDTPLVTSAWMASSTVMSTS